MKINKFSDKESWMQARVGKITGTRLKDLVSLRGSGKKKGFYEMIAERIALPANGENPMDRGLRLEEEAMEIFEKETKKKIDKSLILCVSEENENIAFSPDGLIGKTEAVEVKCLNSASHIEALLTNEIPSEFYFQSLQPFIVNPKLQTLYFIFYDPRIPTKTFFYFTINRKDRTEDIEKYLAEQLKVIKEVEEIVLNLTKF